MTEKINFVCAESSGVPILLCPVEWADQWEGINEPSNGRVVEADFHLNSPDGVQVNYDRACDLADEYVGTISVGPSKAFVFGEEIPVMYWISSETFAGGYALTWVFLPKGEDPDYREIIRSLPNNFFSTTGQTITCSDKGFWLFPSTQSPKDDVGFEFADVPCPAGTYEAALGFYIKPDISLRIIKIQRVE